VGGTGKKGTGTYMTIPARKKDLLKGPKKGKTLWEEEEGSESALTYGTDTREVHRKSRFLKKNQRWGDLYVEEALETTEKDTTEKKEFSQHRIHAAQLSKSAGGGCCGGDERNLRKGNGQIGL